MTDNSLTTEKRRWAGWPVRFGTSYLVLLRGGFIASVVLVGLEVLGFIFLTPRTGWNWLPNVAAIPIGALFGIAIAPKPITPNNQTHAEFAVTRLVETIRSVGSAKSSLDELLSDPNDAKLRAGAELVRSALGRDVQDLVGAASEWDRLVPGVTNRMVKEVEKRHTLAASLGIEE